MSPAPEPRPRRGAFWAIALLGALALALLYLTLAPAPVPAPDAPPLATRTPPPAPTTCADVAAPASGATTILAPATMRRSDVNYSAINFINDSGEAVLARLLTAPAGEALATIYVGTGEQALLSAPTGNYGLELLRGMRWCAGVADLAQATRARLPEGLRTVPGQSGELKITRAPEQAAGISLAWRHLPPPNAAPQAAPAPQLSGSGTLELHADASGHHQVAGSLNRHPVRFVVDTGATLVSVPRQVANAAGLYQCDAWAKMQTANGSVDACIVRNVALTVGDFALAGVDVAVLPTLEAEGLLGMNALRAFRIEWVQGVMRLTPR